MSNVKPTSLTMWTIYNRPLDHPDHYIARQWRTDANGPQPTQSIIIAQSLSVLRDTLMLEMGLTPIARSPGDDEKIVETWL